MSTSHNIGIYVRSCGEIVGATRVDRMIDFYDLLRVLSGNSVELSVEAEVLWWLRVKLSKKSGCWEISRLGPPHSCFMETDSRSHQDLCKNLLAGDMESLVKVDLAYDVKYVIEHAYSKYNYTILYQKAWQALKCARENMYGTWESSY
ncbi:hypothetical protein ACS0TY_020838 [Phlomoides rotata]